MLEMPVSSSSERRRILRGAGALADDAEASGADAAVAAQTRQARRRHGRHRAQALPLQRHRMGTTVIPVPRRSRDAVAQVHLRQRAAARSAGLQPVPDQWPERASSPNVRSALDRVVARVRVHVRRSSAGREGSGAKPGPPVATLPPGLTSALRPPRFHPREQAYPRRGRRFRLPESRPPRGQRAAGPRRH